MCICTKYVFELQYYVCSWVVLKKKQKAKYIFLEDFESKELLYHVRFLKDSNLKGPRLSSIFKIM